LAWEERREGRIRRSRLGAVRINEPEFGILGLYSDANRVVKAHIDGCIDAASSPLSSHDQLTAFIWKK
jgi:hypothetical protein